MHFAPEIDHPVLKTLFKHWVMARGDRMMPGTEAADLTALPLEVRRRAIVFSCESAAPDDATPPRFWVKQMGDDARDRLGAKAEGRFVDEVVRAHDLDVLERLLESVRADCVIHYYRTMVALAGGGAVPRVKLLLPLGTPDGMVMGALGALVQADIPEHRTLNDTYHSRVVPLADLEDRPEDFR